MFIVAQWAAALVIWLLKYRDDRTGILAAFLFNYVVGGFTFFATTLFAWRCREHCRKHHLSDWMPAIVVMFIIPACALFFTTAALKCT